MNQANRECRPAKPYWSYVDGQQTFFSDSANTASVEAVTIDDLSTDGETDEPEVYADSFGNRQLVKVDTNYKAGRSGQHPVCLTRTDALHLAGALLDATADTFHPRRCGALRPGEAAEILRMLDNVQAGLSQLREDTLADLLHGTVDKPTGALDDETDEDPE